MARRDSPPLHTPDGRYIVVRGRLWRAANPSLSADVRATLVDMLEAQGHTVVQAPGGREGLGLMETGPPVDLVLTDLGMPGMTGWDVARQIRERWPVVPVGLMTGWGEQQLTPVERSRVSFVITKPFDLDALSLALAEIRPRAASGHEAA